MSTLGSSAAPEAFDRYRINDLLQYSDGLHQGIGPCALNPAYSNTLCGGKITDFKIADTTYSTSYLVVPMGLPVGGYMVDNQGDLDTDVPGHLMQIGANITSTHLHEDKIMIKTATLTSVADNPTSIIDMATGGSYTTGTSGGVFALQLFTHDATATDVGFRCAYPIPNAAYSE
ncbi:MAG: hypothetical protein WCG27_04230 [Pseudomonadota bacterium]